MNVVVSKRGDSDQCHHHHQTIQGSVRSAQALRAHTRLLQGRCGRVRVWCGFQQRFTCRAWCSAALDKDT